MTAGIAGGATTGIRWRRWWRTMRSGRMAAKGSGRTSRSFQRLAANLRARRDPCWLCGQGIDYTLDRSHPDSFTVDHEKPLSTHPHLAEDPANLRAAHRRCNSSRGNGDPRPTLGATSRAW